MNEDIHKNLIYNVKTLRKQKKISQRVLSDLLGFESSYMGKIENGKIKPSLDKMIAIANFFEMEFVDLFKEK